MGFEEGRTSLAGLLPSNTDLLRRTLGLKDGILDGGVVNFADVGTRVVVIVDGKKLVGLLVVGRALGKPLLGTRVTIIVEGVRLSDGKKLVTAVGLLVVGRALGKGVGLTLGETVDSILGAKVGLALKIALGTAEEEKLGFTDRRALGK